MPWNRHLVLLALIGSLFTPLPGRPAPSSERESPGALPDEFFDWLDSGISWCVPSPTAMPGDSLGQAAPPLVQITADGATLDRKSAKARFSGDVDVDYGEAQIRTEEVLYDRTNEILEVDQPFYFGSPDLRLAGSQARFDLAAEQGAAEGVEFRLPTLPARGSAATAMIHNAQRSSFTEIDYTGCPPGDNGWRLSAADLSIDRESGVGTAHDATLRFKGIPFVYLPFASFPIDDRRMSGFLAPSIGHSDSTGFDFSLPYYFNIAPNMDATLTPRIMSKRGLALGGELRYLRERHGGELRAEILPDDRDRDSDDPSVRGAFSFTGQAAPADRWRAAADINYVSDNDYLKDVGKSLALTSRKQLERSADLRYFGNGWNLLARVQDFQTIADDTENPYSRLPQILVNMDSVSLPGGFAFGLDSEYAYFHHDQKERGHRVDIQPSLSLPLERHWGFLTPKLSGRYTAYQLEERSSGLPDNPDRLLGSFSLDSGLFFEKRMNWFGNRAIQTLEPRLFYLYTPYEDQSDLPVFDSDEVDFSFNSLFWENRFSGRDRIGDANQLTAALSTRVFDEDTNRELFGASIGQIIYFDDRDVYLPTEDNLSGEDLSTDGSSSVVAEVSARLSESWQLLASTQWSPHKSESRMEKSTASLRYRDSDDRVFNVAYRFLDELLEQTDVSMHVPLSESLNLMARWNYSMLHNQTMGAFGGIEYNSCCWTVRAVVRQFVTEVDTDPDVGILFQLELKGLTSLGSRVDAALKREVLGYEVDN